MVLVQSIGLTWLGTCVFLIMVVLKLEEKVEYGWFVTFIPRFVVCVCDIIWVLVRIVSHARTYSDPQDVSMKKKVWHFSACWLEIVFGILLCLKLENIVDIPLYSSFIPLWIMLAGYVADFFYFQIDVVRS